jgi:O-antigen/teichoic acid export membrane protein
LKSEFLVILVGRILIAILGLLSLRVMTTYLSPVQYAEIALLASIQAFIGLLLINPVGQYLVVNIHAWHDKKTLLSKLKSYEFFLAVSGVLGGFAVAITMYSTTQSLVFTVLLIAILIFLINWSSLFTTILNLLGFQKAAVFWGVVTASLAIFCSTALVLLVEPTVLNWLMGQVTGLLLGSLGARYYLAKNLFGSFNHRAENWINIKNLYSFCAPLALATLLLWFLHSGYRFGVEYIWGLDSLAFFAVGMTAAAAVWSLLEAVTTQYLHPYFYRGASSKSTQKLHQVYSDLLNVIVPVYFLVSGAMIFSAPYILKVLVDSQYESSLIFLIIGVIVELFRQITSTFALAAQVTHTTHSLVLPYALGVLTLSSALIMGNYYQVDLVVFVVLLAASGFITMGLMVCKMRSILAFDINYRIWFFAITFGLFSSLFVDLRPGITWLQAFIHLAFVGIVASLLIFILLRKNSSFLRLINIPIK